MATPVDAGSIFSDVRVRLDKLSGDIKSVQTSFDKMGTNVRKSSDKTTKTVTNNFKDMGLAGTVAIGAITLAFKKAVTVFATTEQSLANVRAVTNSTAAEFKLLQDAAAEAGTTTRFTAGQAAEAMFFLSSAGLSATESINALDGVLQLAGATGSDLAQTAQAVTSTLAQFSIAAEDSARVANVFAAANSNSQATLEKLQGSLRQVGPVAAGLNIELEEVVGSLQALFNAGFQGESAGRALKSALADLANEASPTISKLSALGVAFDDVNPEAVGLTAAIGALEDAGLSTAQVIDAFGKVAGPQLVTLIRTGQDAITEYTEAVTDTNEAARQYATQNDTLAGSIDRFKSATEGASNSLIALLAPIIRTLLDLLSGFLGLIAKAPDLLKALGIGAGVAAGGFLALSKALALLGVTLAGPLGLIAGIGAAVVGLVTLVRKAKEVRQIKLSEEFGDLARELGFVGEAIDDFADKAGQVVEDLRFIQNAQIDNLGEMRETLEELAKGYDLTLDQIIAIAKQSDDIGTTLENQLDTLREQEIQRRISIELGTRQNLIDEKTSQREELALANLREAARLEQEAAIRKQEQEDREQALADLRSELLVFDKLALEGLISEQEALEEKISIREQEIELLKAQALESGVVTQVIIDGIKNQQAAIERYYARIATLNDDRVVQEIFVADQLTRINEGVSNSVGKQWKASQKDLIADLIAGWRDYGQTVAGIASNLFSALNDRSNNLEDAELQRLQKLIDAEEEGSDKRIALQDDFDIKSGEIANAQAERSKKLRKFEAAVNTAAAIIGFLANPGGLAGLGLSIGAGVVGIAQVAAINSEPLPSLQTGGIILPKKGGTVANLAENGSPELALNAGSEGQALLGQFAQQIADKMGGRKGPIHVTIFMNQRKIAEGVADEFNNGNVRVTVK